MSDLSRWLEIKEIVQAALDLPPDERASYLDETCSGDAELRREAEALLAVSSTRADFFDDFQVLPPSMQAATITEGMEIGPYRIIRRLGKGGMGAVYLANDTEHGRHVALKTVPRRGARALQEEKRLLARLQHNNIAILHDSGQTDDGFGYFIMEYVEGEPITTYCDMHKLPLRKRLELFLSVCDAVSFAHRNLIVHRDIKPSNILVTAEGQPKLLDFSIAKYLPSEPGLTRAEERSLTLAFASPEQVKGEDTTTATDIYSLGVLLCLLITGRLPYAVKSYDDLPWAIRNMEPETPSSLVLKENVGLDANGHPAPTPHRDSRKLARQLRGDLDAIVIKTLHKKPERRYQEVSEIIDDLQRFLAYRPIAARQGTSRYRTDKFIRRHRVGAAISVALLLIGIVAAVLFIEQYRETVRQRDEARRQAQRAESLSTFLTSIFEISDPWKNTAETVTARQLLDRAAERIEADLRADNLSKASFVDTLGNIYINLGLYDRAEVLFKNSLSLRQNVATHDDAGVGKSIHNLGLVAAYKGKRTEAKRLYLQALLIQRRVLGPQHHDIALTLYDLAVTLRNMAEYQAAERYYTEALQMRRQIVGKEDSVTVGCRIGLALVRDDLGDFIGAERLYRDTIPIAKRSLGNNHPVVADALSSLSIILEAQQRLDEAETLAREALGIQRSRYGNEHPNIASSLDKLARIEYQRGRNSAALKLSQEALAIRMRFLGPTHPTVANSLSAIGSLQMDAGSYKEAEKSFRQSLDILTASLGLEHPHTATALNNLGNAMRRNGDFVEAERLHRMSLSVREKMLGAQHPDTISTKYALGLLLSEMKRYSEAHAFLDEAIAGFRKARGPRHPNVARALKHKASLLIKQGQFASALPLAQEAYSILDEQLSPGDPARPSARVTIGTALIGLHRHEEAEKVLLEALETLKTSGEAPKTSIDSTLRELISLYDQWGKPDRAESYRLLLSNPQ